jgi:hypothetical protein
MMEKFEIRPGDEVLSFGYPNGDAASEVGFPILRSGRVSSYPLTPAKTVGSLLVSGDVFAGNSGGPVFFEQTGRRYGGEVKLGETVFFVAGLISERRFTVSRHSRTVELSERRRRVEVEEEREMLNLAVVVPGVYIKETIELLQKEREGTLAFATRANMPQLPGM